MNRSLLSALTLPVFVAAYLSSAAVAQDPAAPAQTNDRGFLTGLRGFEDFHEPVGQPLYFESPFNDTGIRALYLKHYFSRNSALQGGQVEVYALQARLALTERLSFIATKDGYSEIETGAFGEDEGWNDLAAGFKYVAHADREADLVITPGIRLMLDQGHRLYGVINGNCNELSPFVSFAKGFGRTHLIGNATLRVPTDGDDGNTVGHWDLHLDFDTNPGSQAVFAPVAELHGLHYLDDGATALPIGGGDYTNLGSQPDHSFVAWASVGFRFELLTKYELGLVYEFALTDPGDDIWKDRVTFDFHVRW
jgi:hypothetical protein